MVDAAGKPWEGREAAEDMAARQPRRAMNEMSFIACEKTNSQRRVF